jgi:hypothetical protein
MDFGVFAAAAGIMLVSLLVYGSLIVLAEDQSRTGDPAVRAAPGPEERVEPPSASMTPRPADPARSRERADA